MNKQTTYATKKKDIVPQWYVIDAADKILGRVATKAGEILMGKNNVYLTSNLDCGDNLIIINSSKIALSGNKRSNKKYYKHTQYPGGLKEKTFEQLHAKSPAIALEIAIKGMLPKNKMGKAMFSKLYIYKDDVHKHIAQKPTLIEI